MLTNSRGIVLLICVSILPFAGSTFDLGGAVDPPYPKPQASKKL
jgi:hypothetical protein